MFDNLFSNEPITTSQKKLPTLRQYAQSATKAQMKQLYSVEIIWVPGQWPNFTLQTHAFRIRITEDNALYDVFLQICTDLEGKPETFGITLDGVPTGSFKLVPSPRKKGLWEKLGPNGYIFKQS